MEVIATINTTRGPINLVLFADRAPVTAANFANLARRGFYDGLSFHRVIDDFMIQGGCPRGDGTGGPGYNVDAEFNDTPHKRGILSMARSANPNSAGSQFFICVGDSLFLDGQYTAFGRVVEGMEVADQIVGQPRGANDLPNERTEMKVQVIEG